MEINLKALFNEAALTSDGSGQLYNSVLWNVETGVDLRSLLGGRSVANSLRTFGIATTMRYAISSYRDKQQLLVWNLYSGEAPVAKITTPGPVTSLAITANGVYCAASVETHIYIWMVGTGDLLCVLDRHYNTVSSLKFTPIEEYLVSSSADGSIMVWDFYSLLSGCPSLDPVYEWKAHSMSVMDMTVGNLFVITSSEDQTCKVFSLQDGTLVSTVNVGECVTAVATDLQETVLIAGTSCGKVYCIQLGHDLKEEYQAEHGSPRHRGRVNAIAISMTGLFFITGGEDGVANVWDMNTLSIIQSKTFRGPVNNVALLLNFNPHRPTKDLVSLPFCPLVSQPLDNGERPESVMCTGAYSANSRLSKGPEPSCLTHLLKQLQEKPKEDLIRQVQERSQTNQYMFDFMVTQMLP